MSVEGSLGPYRIVRPLGAGGMGEVYLAEDSRLGRQVAIKVLPAQFAADPERLARFEQEARAAAALNHPNIAVVHDVGHETDNDGNTTHFLVQEFLDGQDLHSLLQAGPLPRKRALLLGAEIAEALSAAHAAGIVHRDLKPANVFISPAGHATVLDFGLAKLVEPPAAPGAASGDAAESPTMLGTMAGAVLGSAGYMAPEQAAGGAVDHRADLFACGCVLYEMLVGQRAFEGDTLIDTLHAITRTEPEALTVEDSPLDPDLRWLLQKCLAKEPASRYQSAGDLAVDLRRLESSRGPGTASASPTATPPTRRWLPWAVAPLALAVGLMIGVLGSEPDGAVAPALRMSIDADLPPDFGPSYFAISPDGSTIAFRDGTTESTLVIRRLDSFEQIPVLNSEGALGPSFSPDGSRLSFFASGRLWVVDASGGTPRELCVVAQNNSSSFWGEDGFIYFMQWATGTGIWRVPETGGTPEEVIPLASAVNSQKRPRPLPDGRGVSVETGLGATAATQVYFFDGTPSIRVDRFQVRYLDDGRALFVDAGTLSIAEYDPETYAIIGSPTALEEGVVQYELSAAGTLFFRHTDGANSVVVETRFARYSRAGRLAPFGPAMGPNERPQVSPDGTMVISGERDFGGVHVWDVARGTVRRITDEGLYPQWGPDSNTVYFQGRDDEQYFFDRVTLDGSAPRERLFTSSNSIWPTDVSNDGSLLAYYEIHPDTERDLWLLPLDGSGEPRPFLVTPSSERSAMFSPDDRWLAYMSDITGREEIYVRPVDNPSGGEVLVTVQGGREPRWSRDGSEIFFRLDDGLWAVPVTTSPRFTAGEPELLFTGSFIFEEGGRNQQYDVLSGDEFLMVESPEFVEELRVVVDWLDDVTDRQ
jgi:serine/threonine protein kinase